MKKAILITTLLVSGLLFTSNQNVEAATPVEAKFSMQIVKSFANKMNTLVAELTTMKVEAAQDVIEPVVYEEEVVVNRNPCPYGHENCDGNHSECAQGHLDCTIDHTLCSQGHANCDGTHQGQHNSGAHHSGNGNGHHQGNGNCYRQ